MSTEGVWVSPDGKKSFIPLENNPEVFTSLLHDLGASQDLEFYDVYSLDEPALMAMIPRPALGLIFIAPPPIYDKVRVADGTRLARRDGLTYDNAGEDEPVLWFRQTIGNACGLYALIHAVCNGEAREFITRNSILDKVIQDATSLKPIPRADVLYNSADLEVTHMRAARRGDTSAPAAEDHARHHFLAFVKGKDGHLWEMEGSTDGPVDRGALKHDEDMLSEAALEKGVRRFLNIADGSVDFSIIALTKKDGTGWARES